MFSSVGWYLCASDTVSHSTFGELDRGATPGPCLWSLWPRSQYGILPREKAASGTGLGPGLLPHQVTSQVKSILWGRELLQNVWCVEWTCTLYLNLLEVEESGVCPGKDKLVWRESREDWRTSKFVSITFSL